MQSPAEDNLATLRSGLGQSYEATKGIIGQGFDKAKVLAGQANQGLADRGVNPLGGVALGVGAVGAALLLKHLLTKRQEPEYVYR